MVSDVCSLGHAGPGDREGDTGLESLRRAGHREGHPLQLSSHPVGDLPPPVPPSHPGSGRL